MELTVKVVCKDLTSRDLVGTLKGASAQPISPDQVLIGLQHGEAPEALVPVDTANVVFELRFRVAQLPNGAANFLGPYAKGTPAQRFFYLVWVVRDPAGNLTTFGRTKVSLSHLTWPQVEAAAHAGRPLTVTLSLMDARGKPRLATLKAEDMRWEV